MGGGRRSVRTYFDITAVRSLRQSQVELRVSYIFKAGQRKFVHIVFDRTGSTVSIRHKILASNRLSSVTVRVFLQGRLRVERSV